MTSQFEYLKKYFKRYKFGFYTALLFLSLETLGGLLLPTLTSKIIDIGIKNLDSNYILKYGSIMLFTTGLTAVFAIVRNSISSRVSQSIGSDLREDLYEKIQDLSFESIDDIEKASLVTRLTNDVNQIQGFAHGLMRIFIKAPLMGIGSTLMIFLLSPKIGKILLVSLPLVGLIIYINIRVSYPIYLKIQKSLDKLNQVMREYLSGIRLVKAFNRYDYEEEKFEKRNLEFRDVNIKGLKMVSIFNPLVGLIINMTTIAILWSSGLMVQAGALEVGKIVALVNYMAELLFSLMRVSRILNVFIKARTSAERVVQVFAKENEEKTNRNFEELAASLEFKNVYFSYKDSKDLLKDITFSLAPGEKLSIIGSTGSGKTSLVNLIPRFYEIDRGEIRFGGKNIKDINIQDLRDNIGIVAQKALLFSGTISENLRWGDGEASFEELVEVSKIVEAHGFIESFPKKYETYIGQKGVNLSGGQKQRISIARALIKKPKILILDDSTSALDIITEKKLKDNLSRSFKGTSIINIAQKISSVMDSDKILVMENGRIVDMGNHEELMLNSQVYRDIYHSQIGKGDDIAYG